MDFKWFLLGIYFFSACTTSKNVQRLEVEGSNGKRPGWFTNPQEIYPKEFYITGLGIGRSKKEAENNAFSSIAKIFQAKIDVKESFNHHFSEFDDGKDGGMQESKNLIKQVSVSSNQTLLNAEIKNIYYDEKEKQYYVLVVMEKQITAMLIKKKIRKNTKFIHELDKAYKNEKDVLLRFRYLYQMKKVLKESKELSRMLPLLEHFEGHIELGVSQKYLIKERQNLSGKMFVYVLYNDSVPFELVRDIEKKLTRFGFLLSSKEGKRAELEVAIFYHPKLNRLPDNRALFVYWEFSVEIHYQGKKIGVFEKSGRDGQMNKEAAKKRAIDSVRKTVEDEFTYFLETDLFNIED